MMMIIFYIDLVRLHRDQNILLSHNINTPDRTMGAASANSAKFRGSRPRIYVEDLL